LSPYSAFGRADSLDRGLYLPALVRPQGLATLPTAFSRPNLAGLISDRLRSWASPFRGCSRLRWNCIPATPHRPGGLELVRLFMQARQYGKLRHLSALSRKSARRRNAGVTPCPDPCLSWASPLWGLSFGRLGLPFGTPPPAGLFLFRSPGTWELPLGVLHRPTVSIRQFADQKPANTLPCGRGAD
jgi:hypothetical protein